MRHIVHLTPPPSINKAYHSQPKPLNPKEAWDSFDKNELRSSLWELQYGLCAYCERVLDSGTGQSTIEHIIPKTTNPEGTFEYENLVLCCPDPKTCNLHKKGKHFAGADETGRWREGFISPTQKRCEVSFLYMADGSVVAAPTLNKQDAEQTISIVNLNHKPLRTERKEYLASIDTAVEAMSGQSDAVVAFLKDELSIGNLKPFYSAKNQNFRL